MVFRIDKEVFGRLPGLCVGVVAARGIDNVQSSPGVDAALDEAVSDAQERLLDTLASNDPRVQPYRQAFHELGMSPSRYPSSNIALLRRIAKGKGLWRVNPIVDLGNAVSIAYGLPLGAHVVAPDGEGLTLRFSREGDVFVPLGEAEADPTLSPGELVYVEGNLVHTRRWTWRQSEHGKICPDTSEVLFVVDGFEGVNDDAVREATERIAELVVTCLGGEATREIACEGTPCVRCGSDEA